MKLRASVVLLALILQGCSALQEFLAPLGDGRPAPEAEAPPPAERPQQEPIARNRFVLETPDQSIVGEPQLVVATGDNTFSLLAREYGLGYDEMVAANPGIDPWLPGEGTPIVLPTQHVLPDVPHEGIVLNIATKRLFYFPKPAEGEKQVVMTYPIGIGREGWETPLGHSVVVAKATDPSWFVPASVRAEHAENGDPLPAVVPPGPDNPLGNRVLKLDLPGYLIHGTNQPYGVGMRVSHGCVRLYPENIERLYDMVGIGEPVTIVNEPYLVGERAGELFIETHEPLADDLITPDDRLEGVLDYIADYSGVPVTDEVARRVRTITGEALGVPMRITDDSSGELMHRIRVVRNTVEPDPNMPTLAEVRALLDAPADGEEPPVKDAAADVDPDTVAADPAVDTLATE